MRKWLAVLWVLVFALTVGGAAYVAVRFSENLKRMPEFWGRISIFQWLVLVAATVLFYFLDYLRLRFLLSILGVRLSLARGMEAIAVSEFAAVLTPTAEMHVPAAVYFLTRRNISPDHALAAVSTKTAYGIVWVCVTSLTMLFAYGHVQLPDVLSEHLAYLAIPVGLIVLFYLTATLFGRRIREWAKKKESRQLPPWKKKGVLWMARSFADVALIGTSKHKAHLGAHVASLAYVATYCFIGWWLCHCLGLPMSPLRALTVFSTSIMVDYLAPVPGSIGVTEFATAYMIDPRLGMESIFAAVALRILCKYLVLIPGFLITANLIRKEGLRVVLS